MTDEIAKPPFPPFDFDTATQKVRMAENAWNTKDAAKVALAYTVGSVWRNRAEFITGRAAIVEFLKNKWAAEHEYRLIKELWAVSGNRIGVRFAYEYHNEAGTWFRAYGNENWEFADNGLMQRRIASINDLKISESNRRFDWPSGVRPDDYPSLSELGF